MLQIDSKALAVSVLNSLVARDELDLDVMDGLYTAIMLLDPQPEEDFYGAIRSAYRIIGEDLAKLEKLIEEAEGNG